MSHPTTTWAAILAAQVTAIEALTPDVAAAESTFVRYAKGSAPERVRTPLRQWAVNGTNLANAWRIFDIVLRGGEGFAGAATQYDVEEYEARAELVIAYSTGRDKFGDDGTLDLRSLMAEDMAQLRRTIGNGGRANYPDAPDTGQIGCWFGPGRADAPFSIEEARGVLFAVSPLTVAYFRSPA